MELEGLPADGDGDDDSLLDGDTDGLTDDDAEGLTELEGDTLLLGETDGDAELLGDTEGETLLEGEPASSAGAKPARTTPICADNDVVAIKERLPEANAPLLSKILISGSLLVKVSFNILINLLGVFLMLSLFKS